LWWSTYRSEVVIFTHPVYELLNNCMNKTALQDIQKTLNIIRNQIDAVDADTKWAALELMLASSSSVVTLAKKMAKPETKTVTRTVAVPKTKIIKQEPPQTTPKDTERTEFTPIRPQPPLPNQRNQ
jgi:hypothetical protein